MKSGVYQIMNTITSRFYIGSSIDMDHRWYRHQLALRNGNHKNVILQRAFNKHGAEAFKFRVVEYCDSEALLDREQHYLDILCPQYNICKVAGNTLGYRHSNITKRKLSDLNKGKKHSEETKAKMSQARTGKKKQPMSKIGRSNISKARRCAVHKLSADDVRKIKVMLTHGIKQQVIADRFGVSSKTISNINTGRKWGWV